MKYKEEIISYRDGRTYVEIQGVIIELSYDFERVVTVVNAQVAGFEPMDIWGLGKGSILGDLAFFGTTTGKASWTLYYSMYEGCVLKYKTASSNFEAFETEYFEGRIIDALERARVIESSFNK